MIFVTPYPLIMLLLIQPVKHKLPVCNKDIFACGVYIDFKNPFDTVNHEFLLNKVIHDGIKGTEHQWFKTYLRGRQQHTTVNNFSSKNAYINYGVP